MNVYVTEAGMNALDSIQDTIFIHFLYTTTTAIVRDDFKLGKACSGAQSAEGLEWQKLL